MPDSRLACIMVCPLDADHTLATPATLTGRASALRWRLNLVPLTCRPAGSRQGAKVRWRRVKRRECRPTLARLTARPAVSQCKMAHCFWSRAARVRIEKDELVSCHVEPCRATTLARTPSVFIQQFAASRAAVSFALPADAAARETGEHPLPMQSLKARATRALLEASCGSGSRWLGDPVRDARRSTGPRTASG